MLTCHIRPNRLKLLMKMPPNVACNAPNTSFMPRPSACAFSRSMSRKIDGLLAVKVEKTRGSRGSWLAAARRPCITLFIAALSGPSQPTDAVFEPARRRQPDDRRQIERDDRRGADLPSFGEYLCDQPLRRVCHAHAIGEGLQRRHDEGGIRFVDAVDDREPDD